MSIDGNMRARHGRAFVVAGGCVITLQDDR